MPEPVLSLTPAPHPHVEAFAQRLLTGGREGPQEWHQLAGQAGLSWTQKDLFLRAAAVGTPNSPERRAALVRAAIEAREKMLHHDLFMIHRDHQLKPGQGWGGCVHLRRDEDGTFHYTVRKSAACWGLSGDGKPLSFTAPTLNQAAAQYAEHCARLGLTLTLPPTLQTPA